MLLVVPRRCHTFWWIETLKDKSRLRFAGDRPRQTGFRPLHVQPAVGTSVANSPTQNPDFDPHFFFGEYSRIPAKHPAITARGDPCVKMHSHPAVIPLDLHTSTYMSGKQWITVDCRVRSFLARLCLSLVQHASVLPMTRGQSLFESPADSPRGGKVRMARPRL